MQMQLGGVVLQSAVAPRGWRPLPVTGPNLAIAKLSGLPVPPQEPALKHAALDATSEAPMELISIVAAAIVSLAPNLSGEQVDEYASDIAAAVDEECGHDDAHCVELALALVVVQHEESSWRKSVETCRVTGDGGRAISMFQLHRHWWGKNTRGQMCASNRLAAKRAAFAMRTLSGPERSMGLAFRRYVGCTASDRRAVRRRDTLRRLRCAPGVSDALASKRGAA